MYCQIDEETKEHLLKLIDWIYNEIRSAGGDGDCLWYSRFYNVQDILVLVEEYNNKLKFKWEINFDKNKGEIGWGIGQQWATITNNEETYNFAPSWVQCKIKL